MDPSGHASSWINICRGGSRIPRRRGRGPPTYDFAKFSCMNFKIFWAPARPAPWISHKFGKLSGGSWTRTPLSSKFFLSNFIELEKESLEKFLISPSVGAFYVFSRKILWKFEILKVVLENRYFLM